MTKAIHSQAYKQVTKEIKTLQAQIKIINQKIDELKIVSAYHLQFLRDGKKPARLPVNKKTESVLDSILKFFKANKNQWASIDEISKGTERKSGGIQAVIYNYNKEKFEKSKASGSIKFRLMPLPEDIEGDSKDEGQESVE